MGILQEFCRQTIHASCLPIFLPLKGMEHLSLRDGDIQGVVGSISNGTQQRGRGRGVGGCCRGRGYRGRWVRGAGRMLENALEMVPASEGVCGGWQARGA